MKIRVDEKYFIIRLFQIPFYLKAFDSLMDGIERNLTVKNKDAFTQNLAKFRRDIVEIVKGDYVPSSTLNSMV